MTINEHLLNERQAAIFTELVRQDDQALVEQGYGRYVDLWESERLCIYGVAKIYGDVNRKSGL